MNFKKDIKQYILLFTIIDAILTIYGLICALDDRNFENEFIPMGEPILICNLVILIIWLINFNNSGFQEKINAIVDSDIDDIDDVDIINNNINDIFFPYTATYSACTIYVIVLFIMNRYNNITIHSIGLNIFIIINEIVCCYWFFATRYIKNMLWQHINESYESLT